MKLPKPTPGEDKPGVEGGLSVGDEVFYRRAGSHCMGKVLCHGQHGFTIKGSGGPHVKVPWKDYVGHQQRVNHKASVIHQGEDGALADLEDGRRVFLFGYPRVLEEEEAELMGKALFLLKAGVKNKPGLALKPVTDKAGRSTKRWSKTSEDAKKPKRKGAADKPRMAVGTAVTFDSGQGDQAGKIVAAGKDGATVETPHGRAQVKWDAIKGGKASKDDGGKKKPSAKGKPKVEPKGAAQADPAAGVQAQLDKIDFKIGQPVALQDLEGSLAEAAEEKLFEKQKGWSLDKLYKSAQRNQNELGRVGKAIMADFPKAEFRDPGIKDKDTAAEKIVRKGYKDASRMGDVVRAGFLAETPEQASAIVKRLGEHFEVMDEGWSRNREGYFDRKVMVRFKNGMVGEIQLWEANLLSAKMDGGGHEMYEEYRGLDNTTPRAQELRSQMFTLYAKAMTKAGRNWENLFQK